MNIKRITANEFLARVNNDNDVIIDLRTGVEVANECIGNCVHIPVQDLDPQVLDNTLEQHNAQPKEIFLLCQTGGRANMALDKLKSCTDKNFVVIEGGLTALKSAGANIIKGDSNVISLERQVRIAAGFLVFIGVLLGFTVNTNFYFLSGFVGVGLMFAGISNTCAMGMMLAKMPWNKLDTNKT